MNNQDQPQKSAVAQTAADVIYKEHQATLRLLAAAKRQADIISANRSVNGPKIREMLDFFFNFVERCHYSKEERCLFPAMATTRSDAVELVDELTEDHRESRNLLQTISDALGPAEGGDGAAIDSLQESLEGYVELVRRHIEKEDQRLLPLANQVLGKEQNDRLIEQFDQIEANEIGPGQHEKYHQMVDRLVEDE